MVEEEPVTETCIFASVGQCRGNQGKVIVSWHCRPKAKYNEEPYDTFLPVHVCRHHFSAKLAGKELKTIGWDEWDAVDNIVAEYN